MGNINLYPPDTSRADYERFIQTIADAMGTSTDEIKKSYNIMPSVIRMVSYLQPGSSDYIMYPRKGVDTTAAPNSVLLDQNDWFVANGIGLRFSRCDWVTPNNYSNWGNYIPLTFPDPAFFTYTSTSIGTEAQGLNCIVNGTISVKVAGTPVIDNLLASELTFRGDKTYTTSPVAYPSFSGDVGKRGFFMATPTLILDAMADNSIVLNLGSGTKTNIDGSISATTTASTTRNTVEFLLNGWKIKNFASGGKLNRLSC